MSFLLYLVDTMPWLIFLECQNSHTMSENAQCDNWRAYLSSDELIPKIRGIRWNLKSRLAVYYSRWPS